MKEVFLHLCMGGYTIAGYSPLPPSIWSACPECLLVSFILLEVERRQVLAQELTAITQKAPGYASARTQRGRSCVRPVSHYASMPAMFQSRETRIMLSKTDFPSHSPEYLKPNPYCRGWDNGDTPMGGDTLQKFWILL